MDDNTLELLGFTRERWDQLLEGEKEGIMKTLQSQKNQQNSTESGQPEQPVITSNQGETKGATSEQEASLIDKNSKPGNEGITKNSLSIAQQRMRGINTVNTPTYSKFESILGSYVNKDGNLSRKDRLDFRNKLKEQGIDISRRQMRQIGKSFNRGETNGAFNNYVDGLQKRYYVKDSKLFEEGQEGWKENDFNNATYKGTDEGALIKQYNDAVLKWRESPGIKYDPITGKYTKAGFDKVAGADADVDITNSSWAKDKIAGMEDEVKAKQNEFLKKVRYDNTTDSYLYTNEKDEVVPFTADWFKNNEQAKTNLRLAEYKNDVDARAAQGFTDGRDFKDAKSLLTATGFDIKQLDNWDKLTETQQNALKNQITQSIGSYYNNMRNPNGEASTWDSEITADAWWKTMQNNFKNDTNPWMYKFSWQPGGYYYNAQQNENLAKNQGGFASRHKIGGTLNINRVKASYKKGGQINKLRIGGNSWWRSAADFVPVLGSGLLAYDKYIEGDDISDAQMAMSIAGDALTLTPLGWVGKAGKLLKPIGKLVEKAPGISSAVGKGQQLLSKGTQIFTKTGRASAAEKQAYEQLAKFRGNQSKALSIDPVAAAKKDRELVQAYNTAKKEANALRSAKNSAAVNKQMAQLAGQDTRSALAKWGTGTVKTMGYMTGVNARSTEEPQASSPQNSNYSDIQYQDIQPVSTQYNSYITDPNKYSGSQIAFNKQGGNINMNKINYFQEGGAMAPQAAPAAAPTQGGQDIQAQVMQLVQAAMSGDQKATQAIQQIMQAAQQGDQQAMQIAQMIQEVTKQMQGQATAAKYGSKLSYLKSLRSGCPEGYEVSYHKKGGVLCKECVAKSHDAANQTINNTTESGANNYVVNRVNNAISGVQKQQAQDETTNIDIISLNKKGGCLKKKLSCGKKMQEGSKVDEAKCGTKVKAACGTKATMDKCGSKLKKKLSCGKKMQEGDKIDEAKCGSKMKAS